MKRSIFSKSIRKAFGPAVVLAVIATNGFTQNASMKATAAPAPLERRVFVRSKALLVRGAVIEEKLMKRPEFSQLNLVITRDENDADIQFLRGLHRAFNDHRAEQLTRKSPVATSIRPTRRIDADAHSG